MLKAITQIASVLSAVTAVTTSLRAVGKSREHSGLEPEKIDKIIFPFQLVTAIWLFLSVIFAVPSLAENWRAGDLFWFIAWILFFLFVVVVIFMIWRQVLMPKR